MHVYEYGDMGELIHKRSTGYVPVAGGEHYTFSTHWVYDSWNRLKQITYPDGELVRYRYNAGGQLVSMAGEKLSAHQSYIDTLLYDEYGSRTQIAYGNGIVSDYSYAADTRRLSSLQTSDGTNDLQQLSYTYDPVGNITAITNTAGPVSGLGGAFSYTYSYDSLYRLDSAAGSSLDMPYTLAMAYSPSGNILRKTLSASKLILGNNSSESYDRAYSYNGAHQLSDIQELVGSDPSTQYGFDGNGNMTLQEFHDPQAGVLQRTLCWDEENRLSATRDDNYVTANIYDGSGMRAWKLAGELQLMWQNGLGWVGSGDLNLRSWYQSEHMTLTDQGYTKHYFIEGQRIASKLGSGFAALDEGSIQQPVEPIHSELSELPNAMVTRLGRDLECLGLEYPNFYGGSERLEAMDELYTSGEGGEPDVYFYHSDHLGSSSFITDGSAFPTQHLQYTRTEHIECVPFGEDFIQQQNTASYYSPFTFSGKERDFETSLSYFGARYYDAGLSIWLSVDPHSDNYPNASPYCFVENNPIMRIDPDGRDWFETMDEETGELQIKWTDAKNQDELDLAGSKGRYLGEAVVDIKRNENEKLGEDGTLTGKGSQSSSVTIYGVNGPDDIQTYDGLTMTSDPDKYVPIADGEYKMFYQDMYSSVYGTRGAKEKGTSPALTYRVQTSDGGLNIPTKDNRINPTTNGRFKTAIFFHRTDWNGKATRSSTGCPNIDGRQWRNVEGQLGKSMNIFLRISSN